MQPPAAVEQEFDMDVLYANAIELQVRWGMFGFANRALYVCLIFQ